LKIRQTERHGKAVGRKDVLPLTLTAQQKKNRHRPGPNLPNRIFDDQIIPPPAARKILISVN
jgi:hypothetical protein